MSDSEINVLHKAMASTTIPSAEQWRAITSGMQSIASQLMKWGELLGRVSRSPDFLTAEEMAEGLDRIESVLREIDDWLETKHESYWIELRIGINLSQEKYWSSEIKSSFSVYFLWLASREDKPPDGRISKRIQMERFKAGKGLIAFGAALNDAVKGANAYRQ